MKEEGEDLTVEEVGELTGLDPERIRAYIRLGRLRARLAGSAFAEDYRVERAELERDPEIAGLLREKEEKESRSPQEEKPRGEGDLLKLVDRYRAMLDEIARCKLRAASLGGAASRGIESDLEKKTRETEELQKEIERLRGKIIAKESQIRKLGPARKEREGP